jgi:hypothetical protein
MFLIQMALWSEPYAGYHVYVQYFFPHRISVKYPELDQRAVQIRVRLCSQTQEALKQLTNSNWISEPNYDKKNGLTISTHTHTHTHSHMYKYAYVYWLQYIQGFRNTILNLLATQ